VIELKNENSLFTPVSDTTRIIVDICKCQLVRSKPKRVGNGYPTLPVVLQGVLYQIIA